MAQDNHKHDLGVLSSTTSDCLFVRLDANFDDVAHLDKIDRALEVLAKFLLELQIVCVRVPLFLTELITETLEQAKSLRLGNVESQVQDNREQLHPQGVPSTNPRLCLHLRLLDACDQKICRESFGQDMIGLSREE